MLSSYLVSKMTQHLHLTLSLSLILWEVKAADTHLSHLWTETKLALKTLDTFGVCQRPVFSLSVSQHMHEITNMLKFELNWSSKLQDNNDRKHPCHTKLGAFRCLILRPQNLIWGLEIKLMEKKILKNYVTSEGAVSHNVLYNQQFQQCPLPLKGRYTFGNCQRTVFSLGVSQQKHKITSLWKFGLNRSTKLRENDERNNTLVRRICVLSDGINFHCCIFLVTGIQLLFAYPENHVEIWLVILFL